MTEDEWMHRNPRVIQHGQKRRRPVTPGDVFWGSLAAILIGGAVVYAAVRWIGGGA